jgi:hypothetical protein
MKKYWSQVFSQCNFHLISSVKFHEFAIIPFWALLLDYKLRLLEWLLLLFVAMSLVVSAVTNTVNVIHASVVSVQVINCICYILGGYKIFQYTKQSDFIRLAIILTILTFIDFFILHGKITNAIAIERKINFADTFDGRGPYILASEPSYYGLAIAGFYIYCIANRYFFAAALFFAMSLWTHSIYAISLILIASIFLLPTWVTAGATIVIYAIVDYIFTNNIIPTRLFKLFLNIQARRYATSNILDMVVYIENDFGSLRYSQVINSFRGAKWFEYTGIQSYSFMGDIIAIYGLIPSFIIAFVLTYCVIKRYELSLKELCLFMILLTVSGPISIPFFYSFLFPRLATKIV